MVQTVNIGGRSLPLDVRQVRHLFEADFFYKGELFTVQGRNILELERLAAHAVDAFESTQLAEPVEQNYPYS